MKRTAQEIARYVNGELRGDSNMLLESVASLKNAGPSDLSYAEERFQDDLMQSGAGGVMVASGEFERRTVILVRNPKLAFARAAEFLLAQEKAEVGIHPSAVVAPDADIGKNVKIGPLAVIEAGARIGDGTAIGPGSCIGKGSKIGS